MQPLVPYLYFNGNCAEALDFYAGLFNGKLVKMRFRDVPQNPGAETNASEAAPDPDRIMHGMLTADNGFEIMAGDVPQGDVKQGENVRLTIQCDTAEEVDALFAKLAEGGQVEIPPMQTFWSVRHGCLTDQFGIKWILNCLQPSAQEA